jgi:hypothetical protein
MSVLLRSRPNAGAFQTTSEHTGEARGKCNVAFGSWSGLLVMPRPEPWEPLAFTSPLQALELGLFHSVYFYRVPL